MEKMLRLKSASMMLFWFGILAQLITVWFVISDVSEYGYPRFLTYDGTDKLTPDNVFGYAYFGFIHLVHVLAGYLLAKGSKKGIWLGIGISIFEIVDAFSPSSIQYMQTASWILVRIYFAIVIALIVTGRGELDNLKSENWRPWKNPRIRDFHNSMENSG